MIASFSAVQPIGATCSSPPQLVGRETGALCQRLELSPHDGWVHAAMERSLREAAIGAGNNVLAADQPSQPRDAFSDELGMLHHVGCVTDDAGNEHLVPRQ